MAFSFAKLTKLARNVTSLDEALEVLSVLGIEADVKPVPLEAVPASSALGEVISKARSGASGFYLVDANVKGLPLRAFVVLGRPPAELQAKVLSARVQ